MKTEYIITFHTHYEALCCKKSIEKVESEMHIAHKLIPVPRALSSSCGTALRLQFENEVEFDVGSLFESEYDEIYYLDEKGEYNLVSSQV